MPLVYLPLVECLRNLCSPAAEAIKLEAVRKHKIAYAMPYVDNIAFIVRYSSSLDFPPELRKALGSKVKTAQKSFLYMPYSRSSIRGCCFSPAPTGAASLQNDPEMVMFRDMLK